MKHLSLLLVLLPLITQAQFIEDFNDGDFTNINLWSGDDTEFTVNASQQLQMNNAGVASSSYLSTPNSLSDLDSVEWQFYVKQSFSPSGSNNSRVYLVSDQANLTASLNGYYLLFGEAGSGDAISLFEQTNTSSTLICSGTAGAIASSFEVRVKVLRNHLGDWEIWTDYTGGSNFALEASGNDVTHNASSFIGVQTNYTASNGSNFYYDDFYSGDYILDLTPPAVVSVNALSATQVDVLFDENLDQGSAEAVSNYSCNSGIGIPSNAALDGTNLALVHLTLATPLVNGNSYVLTTTNVQDISSNAMVSSMDNFSYFVFGVPAFKDVLINEIFADQTPQVGLPLFEYIELYNNSLQYFNLNGWQFSDGTSTSTFPSHTLAPGDYLIICSESDTSSFSGFGNTLGVSSFPSLNNAGDNLSLTDGSNNVDLVNYDDSWYRDGTKQDGGYSLELINPTIPCSDPNNWIGSFSAIGGTPGTQNSMADFTPDTISPSVVSAYAFSLDSIKIVFSEGLDQTALGSLSLLFSNGLGYLESLDANDPSCLWVQTSPSMTQGDEFSIDIAGLSDCSGNAMSAITVTILVPEDAIAQDIIINEVLFNPLTGGSDFVEIYNNSDKAISLSGYLLANYDNDTISNHKLVTTDPFILNPQSYLVLTTDSNDVKNDYPLSMEGRFLQVPSMPSYNNDSGTVYLIAPNDLLIDHFSYDEDMHFPLLNDVDGVSLERLEFDRLSSDVTNWHSAAEDVGFATPGYLNSQSQSTSVNTVANSITLEPKVFSPDNDGFEDVMNINYNLDTEGYVASIAIFDAHGRLIRWLVQNELLSTSGVLSWDGTTDGSERALIGTYVLFFEVYNLNGQIESFKKACVVAGKL